MTTLPPFPESLERYVAAQRRFDELREHAVARAGKRLCDLAYANPYDGPAAAALEAIKNALKADRGLDLQYTPYGGATVTRRVVAHALGEVQKQRFTFRHVVMTPGAMAALNLVFRAIRRDGEDNEVIVITPCWLDYPLYLAHLHMRPRLVPVEPRTLRLDLNAVERALTPATRAVVLSQPANPTGILYDAHELAELSRMLTASRARPLLVSDECHRDFVHDGAKFVSPADHYDATCIVYSFGKSWFIQGQRIGYVAVSPRAHDAVTIADRLSIWARVMGFSTPTALMQLAVRELVGKRPDIEPIARRRERAITCLRRAGYQLAPSQATFFLYPRVPEREDDFVFCERLADLGVLALPAQLFHHAGHFRLSLTASDEATERALELLQKVRRAAGSARPGGDHASF